MASEYEKVFGTKRRGGRRKLSPAEKVASQHRQKIEYRRKNEAKRRAMALLVHKNQDAYTVLFDNEYKALAGNPKFDISAQGVERVTRRTKAKMAS